MADENKFIVNPLTGEPAPIEAEFQKPEEPAPEYKFGFSGWKFMSDPAVPEGSIVVEGLRPFINADPLEQVRTKTLLATIPVGGGFLITNSPVNFRNDGDGRFQRCDWQGNTYIFDPNDRNAYVISPGYPPDVKSFEEQESLASQQRRIEDELNAEEGYQRLKKQITLLEAALREAAARGEQGNMQMVQPLLAKTSQLMDAYRRQFMQRKFPLVVMKSRGMGATAFGVQQRLLRQQFQEDVEKREQQEYLRELKQLQNIKIDQDREDEFRKKIFEEAQQRILEEERKQLQRLAQLEELKLKQQSEQQVYGQALVEWDLSQPTPEPVLYQCEVCFGIAVQLRGGRCELCIALGRTSRTRGVEKREMIVVVIGADGEKKRISLSKGGAVSESGEPRIPSLSSRRKIRG